MEQKQEAARATVTVIRGHGEDRIRQAIAQGLVREDLLKDLQEVITENDTLRRDLKMARIQLKNERDNCERFKSVYYEALMSKQREDRRKKNFASGKLYGALFVIVFSIILLCTIITNAILG